MDLNYTGPLMHGSFFFFFSLNMYYSTTCSMIGCIHCHGTTDTEDQLWDLNIHVFWYPRQVLELILPQIQREYCKVILGFLTVWRTAPQPCIVDPVQGSTHVVFFFNCLYSIFNSIFNCLYSTDVSLSYLCLIYFIFSSKGESFIMGNEKLSEYITSFSS